MNHYHVQVINTNHDITYFDHKVNTKKQAMREMSAIKKDHVKSGEFYEGRLNDLWLDNKSVYTAIIAVFHDEKCEVIEK